MLRVMDQINNKFGEFTLQRGILLGTETLLPIATEQLILVVFMGISVFLGSIILNKVEKHCKTIGNIGFH